MGDVWNALADPTRRHILQSLRQQDMNAGEIADMFNISKPSISHHLSILKSADLVRSDKQGQNVVYRLNTSVFEDVMEWVSDFYRRGGENSEA